MSKSKNKSKKKLNKNYKSLIKAGCVLLAVALVFTAVYVIYAITSPKNSGLKNTYWESVSAYNASGDEVDMQQVYNNYYSSYQGSMRFKDDNTFTFWMSPGNPEDGTHSGVYTYNHEDDTISVEFGSGDKAKFDIVRKKDNTIKRIEVPYGDYIVYFVFRY